MYRNKKKIGKHMNYKTKILQYLISTKPKHYGIMQELINKGVFDKILKINLKKEDKEDNNQNVEESFIEKLTFFVDFFHNNFPSIKEKGHILELILTTNIPEFLTTPITLKELNDKYIIYSMKKTIVNNFLTIFKQIRNNIPIQELNKIKIKYNYNLDKLTDVENLFNLLKDLVITNITNDDNLIYLFDNYANKMTKIEKEYNLNKKETINKINNEYTYYYKKIFNNYQKRIKVINLAKCIYKLT